MPSFKAWNSRPHCSYLCPLGRLLSLTTAAWGERPCGEAQRPPLRPQTGREAISDDALPDRPPTDCCCLGEPRRAQGSPADPVNPVNCGKVLFEATKFQSGISDSNRKLIEAKVHGGLFIYLTVIY